MKVLSLAIIKKLNGGWIIPGILWLQVFILCAEKIIFIEKKYNHIR